MRTEIRNGSIVVSHDNQFFDLSYEPDNDIELNWMKEQFDIAIQKAYNEAYNQAVKDCAESATAFVFQESVNGGKVAKVSKESILKNLKK